MINKIVLFFSLFFIFSSCQNDDQKRIAENKKELQKREVIFNSIKKGWIFYDTPITEAAENNVVNWNEWRLFLAELAQKPKKAIGAFQQKSKAITKRAIALNDNIPLDFSKPQIKSRISALIAKVQMLDLYIHLATIPDKKVIQLINEINREIEYLQLQLEEIVIRSQIPKEEGEPDLIRMKDTTRAIPNLPIQK